MIHTTKETVYTGERKFSVGDEVWANAETGWYGLKGCIKAIHTYQKQGQECIVIEVDFEVPQSRAMIRSTEYNFGEAYQCNPDIKEIPISGVKIEPDGLEPVAGECPETSDRLYVLSCWCAGAVSCEDPVSLGVSKRKDLLLRKMEDYLRDLEIEVRLENVCCGADGDMEFCYSSMEPADMSALMHFAITRTEFYRCKEETE